MYSFGQPRVGNGPFAKDYGELLLSSLLCALMIDAHVAYDSHRHESMWREDMKCAIE